MSIRSGPWKVEGDPTRGVHGGRVAGGTCRREWALTRVQGAGRAPWRTLGPLFDRSRRTPTFQSSVLPKLQAVHATSPPPGDFGSRANTKDPQRVASSRDANAYRQKSRALTELDPVEASNTELASRTQGNGHWRFNLAGIRRGAQSGSTTISNGGGAPALVDPASWDLPIY